MIRSVLVGVTAVATAQSRKPPDDSRPDVMLAVLALKNTAVTVTVHLPPCLGLCTGEILQTARHKAVEPIL